MDKSWINQHRLHPEYIQGVKEFIKFACENKPLLNEVTCPCKRCRNVKLVEKGLLGEHLMINGFLPSYTSWIFHGENLSSPVPHNVNVGQTDSNDGDETYEMLYEGFGLPPPSFIHETASSGIKQGPDEKTEKFFNLLKEAEREFLNEFPSAVKETFFADDPLRHFKDQTKSRKIILGMQAVFPILEWAQSYNLSKFRGDLIAGLTIASLCIPQDIGYSKLANLQPQYGLYSSFVPPLIYAFMGSSRDIAIGPVAVVSLLLGTLLQNEIDPTKNAAEYLRLAFTATFFARITQAALGFLRLGFLIDFLSHAAVVGFMAGAAITIALQQLKGFLGIKKFTKKTDIISVMHSVFGSAHHGWNWQTILIGATFLAFLLFAKYIGKKNKKLFWVPAIAPLISVVLSTFFVFITHAEKQGVQIVNHIEKGINPVSVNQIYFTGDNLLKGFRIGVVTGVIALTEAVAIGRTFAAMKDYQLDGNKEMVAIGAMNIVGSMTSCYVATGSFSRSAVNYMSGCQTAVSNIETKKNNGVPASRSQVWMAAYMKDGTSNSDSVNEVMTQMNELAEHMEGSSTDPAALQEQIFTQVMGPERPGRVRTFGLGPSPTDVFGGGYRRSQEQNRLFQTQVQEQVQEQLQRYQMQFESKMNEVMEKQIQAIRTDFQSRIQFLESQLQAAGVPVDPVVAPSNPLHRQQVVDSRSSHPTIRPMSHQQQSHAFSSQEVHLSKKEKKNKKKKKK